MVKRIILLLLVCIAVCAVIAADRHLSAKTHEETLNLRLCIEKGEYRGDAHYQIPEAIYEIRYGMFLSAPKIYKSKDGSFPELKYYEHLRLRLSHIEMYLLHKYILSKQNPNNEYYFPNYKIRKYYKISYCVDHADERQNIRISQKNFDNVADIKNLYNFISLIYFVHKYGPYILAVILLFVIFGKYNGGKGADIDIRLFIPKALLLFVFVLLSYLAYKDMYGFYGFGGRQFFYFTECAKEIYMSKKIWAVEIVLSILYFKRIFKKDGVFVSILVWSLTLIPCFNLFVMLLLKILSKRRVKNEAEST